MEKPGGPKGARRHLKPESLLKSGFAQDPQGDPKVARMAAKRKRCVKPFPTFWAGLITILWLFPRRLGPITLAPIVAEGLDLLPKRTVRFRGEDGNSLLQLPF